MTTPSDLLPPNSVSAPFETSLAFATGDVLPVPIRQAVDPHAAPIPFLPFLAVHEGVRLWFYDWSEARKRQVISQSIVANFEVGTRAATIRYLSYVDAMLIDAIAYPKRFVVGRAKIGRTPVNHPDFTARYLVKVVTHAPRRAFVIGRSPIGRRPIKTPSREPFNRVCAALRAAKAPETQYRVDFAHKRHLTFADAPLLDGSHRIGEFIDRTRL